MKNLFILPSILLLIALAPLPYGYYYLLKFVVFFTAIKEIIDINNDVDNIANNNFIIIFSAIALLYNPIIAIPLGKIIWSFVNIATIIFYFYYSQQTEKH